MTITVSLKILFSQLVEFIFVFSYCKLLFSVVLLFWQVHTVTETTVARTPPLVPHPKR